MSHPIWHKSSLEQTKIEIKHQQHEYYAVLSMNKKTLAVSESFKTHAGASKAGNTLLERYLNNMQADLHF
jgi:uncharacterized protein YegP (UPF0339 family)